MTLRAPTREGLGDYIDGRFVRPLAPEGELALPSPADLDDVPGRFSVDAQHAGEAIEAARRASAGWRRTSVAQRGQLLRAYGERLRARRDELARAISRAIGKPLWESLTEVDAMIGKVGISLGAGLDLLNFSVSPEPNTRLRTRPIGVCAVIGPFNFPGHLANGHIVPALATGNTVVFKPSERAPEVGELMARCFDEAGLPRGVINVVQGGAKSAEALVESAEVDAVMFTGSTAVGSKILAASARFPGRLIALELGGRNPALVLDDAELSHAAREIAFAAFVTAGQRCTANSRVLVSRRVAGALIAKLEVSARETRVGPPDAADVFLGPVIDEASRQRFLAMAASSRDAFEARVEAQRIEVGSRGYYLAPSLYVQRAGGLDPARAALGREELFAPSLTVEIFDDEEQAIALANDNRYGLAAAVFTASRERFERIADELEVGLCNWNRSTVGSSSKLPFGGRRASGNHRPAGVFSSLYCVDAVAELHVPTPPTEAKLAPGLRVG